MYIFQKQKFLLLVLLIYTYRVKNYHYSTENSFTFFYLKIYIKIYNNFKCQKQRRAHI